MRSSTLFTPDTLNNKGKILRHDYHIAAVMPITDEAARFAAGTFDGMQLQFI